MIYIVSYIKHNFVIDLFATKDKEVAIKYQNKFNSILKKWKTYYFQFNDKSIPYPWIKKEYEIQYGNRYFSLLNIELCLIKEIKEKII